MARLRTRAELRTAAREQSDQQGSQFITDAVANDWLNTSYARYHAMLAKADPGRFYLSTTVATTAGTASYALPPAFMAVLGVDLQQGNRRIPIEPFAWNERVGPDIGWVPTGIDIPLVRYRIMGTGGIVGSTERIHFDPDPGTNLYTVHYVIAPQLLAADGDQVDGVAGWDDWIVYDVAARMARKAEDYDLMSTCIAERDAIAQQITELASLRDMGSAPQVADVRSRYSRVPRAR